MRPAYLCCQQQAIFSGKESVKSSTGHELEATGLITEISSKIPMDATFVCARAEGDKSGAEGSSAEHVESAGGSILDLRMSRDGASSSRPIGAGSDYGSPTSAPWSTHSPSHSAAAVRSFMALSDPADIDEHAVHCLMEGEGGGGGGEGLAGCRVGIHKTLAAPSVVLWLKGMHSPMHSTAAALLGSLQSYSALRTEFIYQLQITARYTRQLEACILEALWMSSSAGCFGRKAAHPAMTTPLSVTGKGEERIFTVG